MKERVPFLSATRGVAVTLRVTEGERGEWAVLQVTGEMDLVTSPVVRQGVHDVVADGRHDLVLDLSEVFFCDSSGVGVLIATRRLIRSCQGRLRLILPAQGAEDGSHVNRVLAALGVRRLFDVYPDLVTALDEESRPMSA
jgi:anti-sigma B factor antagonist